MYVYAHITMALALVVKYWGILKGEMLNFFRGMCLLLRLVYYIYVCTIYIYIRFVREIIALKTYSTRNLK